MAQTVFEELLSSMESRLLVSHVVLQVSLSPDLTFEARSGMLNGPPLQWEQLGMWIYFAKLVF